MSELRLQHRRRCARLPKGGPLKVAFGYLVLLLVLSFVLLASVNSDQSTGVVSPPAPSQLVQRTGSPPDLLDTVPPRPGESFITFNVFLGCLAARLRVDTHQQRELPIRDDEPFIPYLVAPITFELRELKAFVCNVTVPTKRLMIVLNSNLTSVTEFLTATTAAFAFTDRLRVRHFPRNLGYVGALNVAMRDALTFSFDEVPFFFMSNLDIRFSPRMWEDGLPRIRADALTGKPLLEALRAEVATEPNEHTPPHFRDVPLRSTDGKHLLQTSPSLPDRVRYMTRAQREVVFKDVHGFYYPDRYHQTAVWGLSRLAMETAGFFDENCYPAYYEDTDYLDRLALLGLRSFSPLPDFAGVHHFGQNFVVTEKANAGSASLGDTLAYLRGTVEVMHLSLPALYIHAKPSMVMTAASWVSVPGGSLMPPDAWVLNEERRLAIEELAQLSIQHYAATGVFAKRRSLTAIIGAASCTRRRKLYRALAADINVAEQYRDGNSLRAVRSPT